MSIFIKFTLLFLLLFGSAFAQSLVMMKEGDSTPLPEAQATMKKKDCGKIDLTKKMAPVHNQLGASGYAVGAADLINFDQQPKQYSALHLAFTYEQATGGFSSNSSPLSSIQGLSSGLLDQSLEEAITNGVCPESVIPSIDKKKLNSHLYEGIVQYYREADAQGCKQYDLTLLENVFGLSDELQKKLETWKTFKRLIETSYPGFDIVKLEQIYKDTSIDQFFRAVAQESCKGKLVKFKNKKVNSKNILKPGEDGKWYFSPSERESLLNHVNETLSKQRPVGITFESGGLIKRGTASSANVGTVSGRRWMEKSKDMPAGCYFVVKNNWSTDWKVPSGLKARTVSNLPGYFMMSEQSFLEHVHGTTSLD